MIDPFRKIDDKDKIKLLKLIEGFTYKFSKNVDILTKLKLDDSIGILIKGSTHIIKIDYNGNKTIVDELLENSIFSSKTLFISDSKYELITKSDTEIIIIDYPNLINNINNNTYYFNQFIKNLLSIVIDIINERNERIEILTKKSIRNKILEYLNIESKKHSSKNIYLPFSYTDLADYLAIDRCAMTREIKHLKDEGFIKIDDKRITLLYK